MGSLWGLYQGYPDSHRVSKKKREQDQIKYLKNKRYELEQKHKKGKENETQHLIVLKKDELNSLMEQEMRQTFNKVSKKRDQWENEPAKYLTRVPKENKSKHFIGKI